MSNSFYKIIFILIFVSSSVMAYGEDDNSQSGNKDKSAEAILKDIQVSAYFQGQYQYGQKDVSRLGVGASNENPGTKSFNRYGLRRAYVSTMYQSGIVYGLITLELKDRKIGFSDAFLEVTDPWTKTWSFSAGSINTFFGYELSISPSMYEVVEGTGFIYNLFPDIYDIGARMSYQAPLKDKFLKMDVALVAGNGINQETDSRRDLVGSIRAGSDKNRMVVLTGGGAYYRGFVYQGTENVYKMKDKSFTPDSRADNIGKYAKREYFDIHAQLQAKTAIGKSEIRGEFICGVQPSGKNSTESPNSGERPAIDTYIRNFNGGYFYYLQQIGNKLPLTFLGGYSWYDPNTKVSGEDVGRYNTGVTDLRYQSVNLGLIWFPYPAVKLHAFYEIPFNEKSNNLAAQGFHRDKKDNVLTLRIQYKY